jgi:hypothetical protein
VMLEGKSTRRETKMRGRVCRLSLVVRDLVVIRSRGLPVPIQGIAVAVAYATEHAPIFGHRDTASKALLQSRRNCRDDWTFDPDDGSSG